MQLLGKKRNYYFCLFPKFWSKPKEKKATTAHCPHDKQRSPTI